MSSTKIHLTKDQLNYLRRATGIQDLQKALDYFIDLMSKEGIDSTQVLLYIKKMMEKEEANGKN